MAYPPIILATTRKRSALAIARQAMGELGMPRPTTLTAGIDETSNQLLFLLNSLGERLSRLPLWAETRAEWSLTTVLATDRIGPRRYRPGGRASPGGGHRRRWPARW